ncbi:hypothetical protein HYH03_005790 [Edaphochlamys debaryana]|uniref:BACK domain-containing protein n=1 Tax=Edaphochlamys debaryana TaxID=47281 RepID=A0A835YC75_9CHLO|nr:hypothetical protein HYH03_005790 [Edaphochlamys debaryana]|eukprot:KAG2496190.1 hypothetical protein HYH03_005790 [Edaphochlamys debaryana]
MAPPAVNPRLLEILSSLFGSDYRADCDIQFCLEGAAAAAAAGDAAAGGDEALGPLLPAHSFVLSLACERFRAQLDRWRPEPVASSARPVLRVPLGGKDELPAASLALNQWLADRLAATGAAEAGSSAEPAEPAVLQLYACEDLGGPSFAAVLSTAKPQLVRHFGSTLAALNTPSLTKQLEALPAAGLEALLESDDLGTDSEDSVLTLLATWMRANWARTDAATRKRLCGLVRLTQLSPQAVSCLLLPLAFDYEVKGPEQQAGWFPISSAEAAFVSAYLAAPESWRERTREAQAAAGAPGWHSARPRKQLYTCIDARLTMNRRRGGQLSVVSSCTYDKTDYTCVGLGWGRANALPLSPQPPATGAAAAGGEVLARWAEYAHEGSAVTGSMTLLPSK